ncbi:MULTISPECIES: single-stranded-DNA-specific exonuclease RecJ [unclassified Halanaerobium]|uniref:single-stranded-DNA-specific exonuclease RecJ n=1 Tax=unclassified Halanaerobium TaxID=2641197 RepID=UPI000DF196EE|nr:MULTISPECIES: single-stranded-DNA-specific exonuclease RecJ [unclassified Halanaerobium]RCW43787.1 single-stranded-DNA-specific exonuclease [Halanaerobium sp. MA284_MarDTE_T2]RCW80211.1 single-stranded-DNA-specific exonuclease [Halanaerobium sp. DL-01]
MNKFWELTDWTTNNSDNILNDILEIRGLKTAEEKQIFLESDLDYLSDPFDFKDMEKTIIRIKKAVENEENIMIYGDYDVDGITSTALFYLYLKKRFGVKVKYYLPDRQKEGYGLNKEAFKKIYKQNIDLLITVDCGINAVKEIELANSFGIDVIITDHHTPEKENTLAYTVINPHLLEQNNHFARNLSGVGVAYKICQALEINEGCSMKEILTGLIPLAALGTVADIAKLTNENRILVKHGLKNIKLNYIPGLNRLIEKLKLNINEISAGQIGYIIAPPLNAAGRIDSAEKALELLITEDQKKADKIAEYLININKKRQKKEKKIYQQALQKIEKSSDICEERAIILADRRWHSGIVGIVASKLVEEYNLPVILIAVDKDGVGKGSGRSIPALNLFNTLNSCRDDLINFGGHYGAAGLTINMDSFQNFKNDFISATKEELNKQDFVPKIKADMMLDINDITKKFVKKLDKLRPFGVANPSPKFLIKNIKVSNCFKIGKEKKHLKFNINSKISAIAFNMGYLAEQIQNNRIDTLCQLEINRWQGRENIQLKIIDVKISNYSSLTAAVFNSKRMKIFDYRKNNNKLLLLENFIDFYQDENISVYINNQKLKHKLIEKYKDIYFFSDADNRKISRKNFINKLIFFSLPFSLEHFSEILHSFTSKDEKLEVVFMFSKKDIALNKRLISINCPDRNNISEFYIFLKKEQYKNEDLNSIKNSYINKNNISKKSADIFENNIKILKQIGLIKINNSTVFFTDPGKNKLDLSNSIRYNKLSRQMEKFDDFVSAAYKDNLFDLIDLIKNFEEENDES